MSHCDLLGIHITKNVHRPSAGVSCWGAKFSLQVVPNSVSTYSADIGLFVAHQLNCSFLVFRFSKDLYLIMTQKLRFMKSSGRFHLKSGGFQVKSTQNLIKSDVSTKTSVWGVQGGGYDPRFHEIRGHSPSPAFIKLNSFGWNICFYKVLGGFHMNHVKSKDHLQGIVTLCLDFFRPEKKQSL